MSEGDFEVMPRGTMEEVKALRSFAKNIIELSKKHGANIPSPIQEEIAKIDYFYSGHVWHYPTHG